VLSVIYVLTVSINLKPQTALRRWCA